ncbi:MAG: TIGR04150 pseudo-rSAM protein [Bacteroidales bacterium]|nr:TIGR04150 pseudo-rSAM protein [Bacteroidales bacterium]MBN2751064.1 TIGR04150 pseudo-rSAM protein [Bacteroidales bacterium]
MLNTDKLIPPKGIYKYWFTLSKNVYVSNLSQGALLLYNTVNGQSFESSYIPFIEIVKDIHKPENLGIIGLKPSIEEDQQCWATLQHCIEKKIGLLINVEEGKSKPINLLPILSLQKDIDKFTISGEQDLIGHNIMSYLTELNIYINTDCEQSCPLCTNYHKQVNSCFKGATSTSLSLKLVETILNQASNSSTKNINILGGNIFRYSLLHELLALTLKYKYEYHFWINHKNFDEETYQKIASLNNHTDIIVSFPLGKGSIESVAKICLGNDRNTFQFFIETEEQYNYVSELVETFPGIKYHVHPIYNGTNIKFFEKNIFLTREDILSDTISMRKIFCNQKLNSNNFGSLTVLPDASIHANLNSKSIGDINKDSLLDCVYAELVQNTAWRKVRNFEPCNRCSYQYLCPSPSNYETVIGKLNLCNVNA